jgi:hypothetical protein
MGAVNMTDGLPWPAKAVPQILVQIIIQVDVSNELDRVL